MYCEKCGRLLDEGTKFCPYCGAAQPFGADGTAGNEPSVDPEPVAAGQTSGQDVAAEQNAASGQASGQGGEQTQQTVPPYAPYQPYQPPYASYQQPVPEKKNNGMAIAGFICAFFIPILGWIFGGIGLSNSRKMGGKGKGLSIAAIIIATVGFIFNLALNFIPME